MYKVALWGIGDGYNLFSQLKGYEMVEVVVITDRNCSHISTMDGKPVVEPRRLKEYEFDYLVVSVIDDKIYKLIIEDALSIGIAREIILPLRIFQIPFFDFDKYIKIKESNISIISDYCFGGYLYHRFGLKFMTPTINMYADNDNYYRFISNLKYYMSIEMEEVTNIVDEPYLGKYAYPRGRLDDVEWEFNHDITYKTAFDRWERGRKRFNWKNYIVIMTIQSDAMAELFNELPISHKMGFYWKDMGLDSVVYLSEWNKPSIRAKFGYEFNGLVNRVADEQYGIRAINWMKALLHEDGYVRVT